MAPPGRRWLQCWYRKTNYIPLIWQKCVTTILCSLTRQANRHFYYLLIFCSLPNFWSCKYFHVYLTTQRLFPRNKAMFILLNWETVPSSLMQVRNLALLNLPVWRGEEGSKMSAVFNTLEHACARTRMCTHTHTEWFPREESLHGTVTATLPMCCGREGSWGCTQPEIFCMTRAKPIHFQCELQWTGGLAGEH